MKRLILLTLALILVGSILADTLKPAWEPRPVESPQGIPNPRHRITPTFEFSVTPTSLLTNYYDYMIGAYNGFPLRVIPDVAGGGYFMTYHARRQPTATRRVFYSYLDTAGNVINNNEITDTSLHEGFSSLAIDPVSGKPFYAWHVNVDADTNNETVLVYDLFIEGIAGVWGPLHTIGNAPTTIDPPSFPPSTDNEFIWPTAVIGPSPIDGKRRIYVAMRNYVTHSSAPSENPYIAYADFNEADIMAETVLNFTAVTIPQMDDWNNDPDNWRRPFMAIAADNTGKLFYTGYHYAQDVDGNDIDEPDIDVYVNSNYGMGVWDHVGRYSNLPTWNPPEAPGSTIGYFSNADEVPYADEDLSWNVANSSHLNAIVDNDGKLHFPAIWALSTNEGTYYPNIQFMKELVFNPNDESFQVREVYPVKEPTDTFNQYFTPWDIEAPWGEVDEYGGNATDGYYPLMVTDWPFPLWDETAHTDAMMFHYNNYKMTEPNAQGQLAALWQNSYRARLFNSFSDAEYSDWANVPEIFISVSRNQGQTWSEPIVLNNIDVPQMANIKPMWVYPADKMIYVDQSHAKLGVMFYDDYTWGSFVQTPSYHPTNDGGRTMFMELLIDFNGGASDDPSSPAPVNVLHQNYPNPFNPSTTISFDLPRAGQVRLDVFNVKGQLVKTLINGNLGMGRTSVIWDGTDADGQGVNSGLYFYRLNGAGINQTRRMMLVK